MSERPYRITSYGKGGVILRDTVALAEEAEGAYRLSKLRGLLTLRAGECRIQLCEEFGKRRTVWYVSSLFDDGRGGY